MSGAPNQKGEGPSSYLQIALLLEDNQRLRAALEKALQELSGVRDIWQVMAARALIESELRK